MISASWHPKFKGRSATPGMATRRESGGALTLSGDAYRSESLQISIALSGKAGRRPGFWIRLICRSGGRTNAVTIFPFILRIIQILSQLSKSVGLRRMASLTQQPSLNESLETQMTGPLVTPLNLPYGASPPNRLPGWLILLLAASCGLIAANLYYAQPMIGLIAPSIGLDPSLSGLMVTLTQVGYCVGLILLVPLGDLLENRRVILWTLALAERRCWWRQWRTRPSRCWLLPW
jgi:hypothetical protein